MKFAVNRSDSDPLRDRVADAVAEEFRRRGFEYGPLAPDTNFVLNMATTADPQPFHRHAQALFIASFASLSLDDPNIRSTSYATLIRTLSNVVVTILPPTEGGDQPKVHFTTPETGFYGYPFDARKACDSLMPIVSARFVMHNRLTPNLPERLWQTSPVVEQIKRHARELDQMGVLPTPFPLRDILPESELKHIYEVFEMTGLSYGNMSARESVPELSETTFWMSARGVDKAKLSTVGVDILLVTGYDEKAGDILVSVPPEHDERARASVDAIEHCLIYSAFPQVGAIVHVHAWLEGIAVTRQNYQCGTIDLAREVMSTVERAPDPGHAVIGLKNHGLTITGSDLEDIFTRIRGRLLTEVPMVD
jgi:ribulose-5-phosphate 4-epimerase/fuculose-1-phosphate aldolase